MIVARSMKDLPTRDTVSARVLDGVACAASLEEILLKDISELGLTPHLAVIIVGDDPASHIYVGAKIRACERLGIQSTHVTLQSSAKWEELVAEIERMNSDDSVHGILVQSPLPDHMDEEKLASLINPAKDVDGFHPQNLGRLIQGKTDGLVPCTPAGVMRMLEWAEIETRGKRAIVLGRSHNVGMPQSLLLAARGSDATVTIVHSQTQDTAGICQDADIIISAIGQPEIVRREWIKPGAVIVDVGINRIEDQSREKGWRLVGDVHPEVEHVASWLSPVPGGVGPMTVAMLMANTVEAAKQQFQ